MKMAMTDPIYTPYLHVAEGLGDCDRVKGKGERKK